MIGKKKGRPRKSGEWTVKLLRDRSRKYFQKCDRRTKQVFTKNGVEEIENPAPYTLEGLLTYLDIPRHKFIAWRKGDGELAAEAERLHMVITANRIEGALDGRQSPAFAQFLLKNTDPDVYREKIEVENSVDPVYGAILERSLSTWKIE